MSDIILKIIAHEVVTIRVARGGEYAPLVIPFPASERNKEQRGFEKSGSQSGGCSSCG
jgi:hypothetical protein